jgi:septal ring-binding cell division protein DamX
VRPILVRRSPRPNSHPLPPSRPVATAAPDSEPKAADTAPVSLIAAAPPDAASVSDTAKPADAVEEPKPAPAEPPAAASPPETASPALADAPHDPPAPSATAASPAPETASPVLADAPPDPPAALAPKLPAIAQAAPEKPVLRSSGDHFLVQLGYFMTPVTAQKVADQFAASGIVVTVTHATDREGQDWYAVRTGEFASAEEATGVLHMIESIGGVQPMLVRRHPPSVPGTPAA